MARSGAPIPRRARQAAGSVLAAAVAVASLLAGCGHIGPLQGVGHTVAPVLADTSAQGIGVQSRTENLLHPLFGDTLIGLVPGTGDSSLRYLGRLRDGYTADTLNIILCGDNRPGYRLKRLKPQLLRIRQGLSLNPFKIVRGVVNVPWAFVRGMVPDFALVREMPALFGHAPKWGREHQVMSAMLAKIDSLHAHGQLVAAVINTGDLVENGQYPAQWARFLRLTEPLTSRVPYFPVAGNHERTDTEVGILNWRTATGLPVGGERLYYCFDSADGWVRFIALDSNPLVDPQGRWTREVQIKYSAEQFNWLVARVKEHRGPVLVMLHHPPFSAGMTHNMEWQRDSVMSGRRELMMRALHEVGISIIASGHEHSYQRALFTWPDGVMVSLVTAGGGAPLNAIPPPEESARLYSEYKVAGSVVKPENVFTSQTFNFTHLRLWFGGGDLYTYSVDQNSDAKLIDKVDINLTRYGIPKIDQRKVPIPPAKGPAEKPKPMASMAKPSANADSTAASKRILTKPAPSAARKRPRVSTAKRDSVPVHPRTPPISAPTKK